VIGCAHHITQRGNNRQDVFFVDDDRRVYLEFLAEQADQYGLAIEGYCLMSNHVHLVAVPQSEEALAQAVGRTGITGGITGDGPRFRVDGRVGRGVGWGDGKSFAYCDRRLCPSCDAAGQRPAGGVWGG
jgi:hypothetical protein